MPPEARTPEQVEALKTSDALVAELEAADFLIIGTPIYNFGVPAALKAWMDQVARAGRTFRFTETGPIGLLETKAAYVMVSSGGTAVGGPQDMLTPHLTQFLEFLGVRHVGVVAADRQLFDPQAEADARAEIQTLELADAMGGAG